jgi:hypothetical protein
MSENLCTYNFSIEKIRPIGEKSPNLVTLIPAIGSVVRTIEQATKLSQIEAVT